MDKMFILLAWGAFLALLLFSISYMITSGVTSYFIYPIQGSIFREADICRPAWITAGLFSEDDICLRVCEIKHDVSNYKIESLKCFCDINNCKNSE